MAEYKDYTICSGYCSYALECKVIDQLKEGWKPLGGVSVVETGNGTYYHQAMVKEVAK